MKIAIVLAFVSLAATAAQAQRLDAPEHWRYKECYASYLGGSPHQANRQASYRARLAAAHRACGPGDGLMDGATGTVAAW